MKTKAFRGVAGLFIFLVCLFWGCDTGIGGDAPAPFRGGSAETGSAETGGAEDIVYKDIKVVPVTPQELREPAYDDATGRAVSAGANDFAFRLSAALAKQTGGENLVCSPLSVWIPLAALVNAADGRHKADLAEALGVPGFDEEAINNSVSGMLYNLTRQRDRQWAEEEGDYHNPLKIANAIFVDDGVTIKQEFAQTFMDYFRGSSLSVDFESPAAVQEVNAWASEHTDGMIPQIIEGFDPETEAALANAVHFLDRWDWEFEPDETEEGDFYPPGGGTTTAFYMLREGDELIYYEDERLQAMPLRFQTGGALYILLPRDGDAAGLLASLTNASFSALQDGLTLAKGKLLLPRFSIAGGVVSLGEILTDLGVPLFAEDSLTGVIEERALQLTGALQKAAIEVDEKGTTAAAVTLLPMATSAGPQEPEKTFEMRCDKPFVFVLYDSGAVVFAGMVNKPLSP
ncbi:MAG: hypothetical protein LBU16_01320 [Treponema sp.]|jgi:serpin B|nr:hypothetical protein [Treponema sp.]